MQSIKNTGVAIMLLFLSYGVYQVIMKPMPGQQGNESVDFSVTDPRTETLENAPLVSKPLQLDFGQSSSAKEDSSSLPLQPVQPSVASRETIPQQLLQFPQPSDDRGSQEFTSAQPQMNEPDRFAADFGPPPSSRDSNSLASAPENNDFGNFQPKTELAFNSSRDVASDNQFNSLPVQESQQDAGQYQSTPLPPLNGESEPDSQPLVSDTSVVPTGGMTDVSPRSANSLEPLAPKKPSLAEAWPGIESRLESGNFKVALSDLSQYYRDANLQSTERAKMLRWLDALAAKVIYSSEHHLRSLPYVIQPGDTIATLARDWQIPAQLIYNVNSDRMPDPNDLTPGVEVKMIQGPFDAEIDTTNRVLTLFLGDLYAGRFAVGSQQLATNGNFRIVDKSASQKNGRPFWIQLDSGIAIYGSDSGALGSNEIALNTVEAEELFSILSATSSVRVLR